MYTNRMFGTAECLLRCPHFRTKSLVGIETGKEVQDTL